MRQSGFLVGLSVVALATSVGLRGQDPAPRAPAPASSMALLPPGDGRDTVFRVCSECHALERILGTRENYDGWVRIVNDMASRGAAGSDEDFDKIVAYLSEHFGRQVKPPVRTNFSGTWTVTGADIGGFGRQFIVTQSETAVTVTRAGRDVVYKLDGTETEVKNTDGSSVMARARWDAGKLVITMRKTSTPNAAESTMTWSLDPAGNLVVEMSPAVLPAAEPSKTIYKRDSKVTTPAVISHQDSAASRPAPAR